MTKARSRLRMEWQLALHFIRELKRALQKLWVCERDGAR
jgi:hypothetical protein